VCCSLHHSLLLALELNEVIRYDIKSLKFTNDMTRDVNSWKSEIRVIEFKDLVVFIFVLSHLSCIVVV